MYQANNVVAGTAGINEYKPPVKRSIAEIYLVSDKLFGLTAVLHQTHSSTFAKGSTLKIENGALCVDVKVKYWGNSEFAPKKTGTIILSPKAAKLLGLYASGWERMRLSLSEVPSDKPGAKQSIESLLAGVKPFGTPKKSKTMDNIVRRKPVSKPRKASSDISFVSGLLKEDVEQEELVRLHASVMRDYVRDEIAMFVNKNTGLKTFCVVRGCAEKDSQVSQNGLRAAYKLRSVVQYKKGDTITIRKPNAFEKLSYKVKQSNYAFHAYVVGLLGVAYGIFTSFNG